MPTPDFSKRDLLADFEHRQITLLDQMRLVFVAGTGPAVIVMAEIPGIHPQVAHFARRVRDQGFTVFMPQLFGDPGRPVTLAYGLRSALGACIRREFRAFAANESSPVTAWLRALAAHVYPACGGRGVGAIGMCFTGNFALSMMLEPAVLAPVLCQPSLPIGNHGAVHLAPQEVTTIRARLENEDLTVLAYRFAGDSFCRAERFAAFQEALGPRFLGRVLPDSAANPDALMRNPHSVVTGHLIDRDGEPTRQAVDEILGFFKDRLHDRPATGAPAPDAREAGAPAA